MASGADNGAGGLPPQQQAAVEALVGGARFDQAAAAAGVDPRTLRRWRAEGDAFRAALCEATRSAFADGLAEVRGLVGVAVELLRSVMQNEKACTRDRVRAADVVLRHALAAYTLGEAIRRDEDMRRTFDPHGRLGLDL